MPFPYDFQTAFRTLGTLSAQRSWISRYRNAISETIDDFWEPRSTNTEPPPETSLPSTDFTIRMTTTDVTRDVTWTTKDGTNPHGPDAYHQVGQIPTTLGRITNLTNPTGIQAIGPDRAIEIDGAGNCAGGVWVTSASPINFTVGTTGNYAIDIASLAPTFMTARNAGATTLNLIIHGKNELTQNAAEYNYIQGAQTKGQHNGEFYRTSSYITLASDRQPKSPLSKSIPSGSATFRRSVRALCIPVPLNQIAGISAAPGSGQQIYIKFTNPTPKQQIRNAINATYGNLAGITRAYQMCTYSRETITANLIEGSGSQTAAASVRQPSYYPSSAPNASAPNDVIYLVQPTGVPNSIFTTQNNTIAVGGAFCFNDPDFNSGISTTRYQTFPTDPTFQHLIFRFNIPISASLPANEYWLEVTRDAVSGENYLLGNNSLNLRAGSTIRISDTSVGNDGTYQVLAVSEGVPGDLAENIEINGRPKYEYIKLDRAVVTGADPTNDITIEDLTPVSPTRLDITYRQTI